MIRFLKRQKPSELPQVKVRTGRCIQLTALMGLSALLVVACSGSDSNTAIDDPVIRGINYVGMTVTDLERSVPFYTESADMKIVDQHVLDSAPLAPLGVAADTRIDTRLLRSSNAQLRLMQFSPIGTKTETPDAVPVHGPGIAHVCYQVDERTNTYPRFLQAGATYLGSKEMVKLNARNPVSYAYALDPDGAVFEVEHVDVAALELETPPTNAYRIRHVSLATPDIAAATTFYSRLLGGQKPRRVGRFFPLSGEKLDAVSGEPGAKIKMAWLQTRNLELELIEYVSHDTKRPPKARPLHAPGYNMVVFDVQDLPAARQRLISAGGEVVTSSIALDDGQIFFGRDLDGNLLGFQQVAASHVLSSMNFANNGL